MQSRFLKGASKISPDEKIEGKRSRLTLWIITIFIYLVQIGAAYKLLGNGRTGSHDTQALILTFTEGLGSGKYTSNLPLLVISRPFLKNCS